MAKKVLIIEDSVVTSSLLAARIEAGGYDVITAPDAEKGLELVRKNPPDLIILDMRLPGMDGFELCKIIKGDPALKSIPIIAATTCAQEKDKQRGREVGVDSYITKPYDGVGLLEEVDKFLK